MPEVTLQQQFKKHTEVIDENNIEVLVDNIHCGMLRKCKDTKAKAHGFDSWIFQHRTPVHPDVAASISNWIAEQEASVLNIKAD